MANTSSSISPSDLEDQDAKFLALSISSAILCPVIVISNLFVILGPVFTWRLRSPDNVLMVSCAVADLINGLLSMPLVVLGTSDNHQLKFMYKKKWTCQLHIFVFLIPIAASMYSLLAICVDRCIAINYPFFYSRNVKPRVAVLAAVAIWLVSIAQVSSGVFGSFVYNVSAPLADRCSYFKVLPYWWREYVSNMTVLITLVLCLIMCVQTVLVIVRTRRRDIESTSLRGTTSLRSFHNQFLPGVKIEAILIFSFIFLWMPTLLINLVEKLSVSSFSMMIYRVMTGVFRNCNHGINAFVYAYCRKTNRKVYWYMMTHWPTDWRKIPQVVNLWLDTGQLSFQSRTLTN